MSLSHCPDCFDTPCMCGTQYKHLSVEALDSLIKSLKKILSIKRLQKLGMKNVERLVELHDLEECFDE